MKISRLRVKGYKNLIDCELKLGSFNVLIGPNNSGKSNFLETFMLLDTLLNGSETVKQYLFRGVLNTSTFKPFSVPESDLVSIEVEFSENIADMEYKYWYLIEIKINGKPLDEENSEAYINHEYFKYKKANSTGKPITVFERNAHEIKKQIGQKIQRLEKTEAAISIIKKIKDTEDMDIAVQKGIEAVFNICKTPTLYSSPDEIKSAINRSQEVIIKNGRTVALGLNREIIKVLESEDSKYYREVLEHVLKISSIRPLKLPESISKGTSFVLVRFGSRPNELTDQLSDGTLIVLNLITYFFSRKYPIIAIEEIENSIHPKLIKELISLIKNDFSNIQVVVTTHSPTLLNMVQLDEVNIISSNDKGCSKITRVNDRKDLVKRLSGTFSSFSDIFDFELGE